MYTGIHLSTKITKLLAKFVCWSLIFKGQVYSDGNFTCSLPRAFAPRHLGRPSPSNSLPASNVANESFYALVSVLIASLYFFRQVWWDIAIILVLIFRSFEPIDRTAQHRSQWEFRRWIASEVQLLFKLGRIDVCERYFPRLSTDDMFILRIILIGLLKEILLFWLVPDLNTRKWL